MGPLALLVGIGGVAALAIPGAGKLIAVGLGLFAAAAGREAYRARARRAGSRLLGAAALTLGLVALGLGGAKVALTLVAVEHVASLAP